MRLQVVGKVALQPAENQEACHQETERDQRQLDQQRRRGHLVVHHHCPACQHHGGQRAAAEGVEGAAARGGDVVGNPEAVGAARIVVAPGKGQRAVCRKIRSGGVQKRRGNRRFLPPLVMVGIAVPDQEIRGRGFAVELFQGIGKIVRVVPDAKAGRRACGIQGPESPPNLLANIGIR